MENEKIRAAAQSALWREISHDFVIVPTQPNHLLFGGLCSGLPFWAIWVSLYYFFLALHRVQLCTRTDAGVHLLSPVEDMEKKKKKSVITVMIFSPEKNLDVMHHTAPIFFSLRPLFSISFCLKVLSSSLIAKSASKENVCAKKMDADLDRQKRFLSPFKLLSNIGCVHSEVNGFFSPPYFAQ